MFDVEDEDQLLIKLSHIYTQFQDLNHFLQVN